MDSNFLKVTCDWSAFYQSGMTLLEVPSCGFLPRTHLKNFVYINPFLRHELLTIHKLYPNTSPTIRYLRYITCNQLLTNSFEENFAYEKVDQHSQDMF